MASMSNRISGDNLSRPSRRAFTCSEVESAGGSLLCVLLGAVVPADDDELYVG